MAKYEVRWNDTTSIEAYGVAVARCGGRISVVLQQSDYKPGDVLVVSGGLLNLRVERRITLEQHLASMKSLGLRVGTVRGTCFEVSILD